MSDLIFRKIHGRIVPIKMTRKQKDEAIKGAGLAVAGVGVAGAAGKAYPKVLHFSNQMSKRAFSSLMKLDNQHLRPLTLFSVARRGERVKKVYTMTDKLFKASIRVGRLAPALRLGGVAVGSALVAAGLNKLHKASGRKSKTERATVASLGAVVATTAFLGAGFGGPGLRQGIKETYKAAYPAIRALKARLKL